MNIDELRKEINQVDDQMAELFAKRMQVSAAIAEYKKKNNLPVADKTREREIINRVVTGQNDLMAGYTKVLFNNLFDLSRSYQNNLLNTQSKLAQKIKAAASTSTLPFPESATVACQGVEGAYSQIACDKLFSRPSITYMNTFQGVFSAVENNLCKYGVLPIENSLYGSVNEVYDLMRKHNFSIVRGIKLRVNHTLLAKKPIQIGDIKEIYSHQQGIGQCSEFIAKLKGIKITLVENTAVAAKIVAESTRDDIAAISSKSCAELYDLRVISTEVQNSDNNYTRFICISKDLEIYPGANKTSLMFTLPHNPGSLYNLISKFSSLGLNLAKLESRPIPGTDFEFMFYIDMESEVLNEKTIQLLAELESSPEIFVYLGSYSEV